MKYIFQVCVKIENVKEKKNTQQAGPDTLLKVKPFHITLSFDFLGLYNVYS
jgi:hypothetical protein